MAVLEPPKVNAVAVPPVVMVLPWNSPPLIPRAKIPLMLSWMKLSLTVRLVWELPVTVAKMIGVLTLWLRNSLSSMVRPLVFSV
jgi:hypothetical protein